MSRLYWPYFVCLLYTGQTERHHSYFNMDCGRWRVVKDRICFKASAGSISFIERIFILIFIMVVAWLFFIIVVVQLILGILSVAGSVLRCPVSMYLHNDSHVFCAKTCNFDNFPAQHKEIVILVYNKYYPDPKINYMTTIMKNMQIHWLYDIEHVKIWFLWSPRSENQLHATTFMKFRIRYISFL